jgi:tape measure domain-containing protein
VASDFAVSLEVRPQAYVRGTREATTATKGLTESTRESTRATREDTASKDRAAQAERRQAQVMGELSRSYQRRLELMEQLRSQTAALNAIQRESINRQTQLRQQIEATNAAKQRAAASVLNLRNAFFALSGVLATLGLTGLVREGIQLALTFDRIHNALTAATGSHVLARQEMVFVTAEADRLGLVLTNTAQTYAGLTNAARGTILEGEGVRTIFSGVSEAATVLGKSAADTNGILLGVQQTISKGKVTSEELVQQISERLPGAYQAMATSLGITTGELGKRLEQGKVGLQDLVGWAEQLRKQFSSGLLAAVNSDQANLNRLQNMVDQIKASLGEGFLSGFLAGFQDLRENLSGEELRAAAQDLGESIGSALRTAADAATTLAKNLEMVKLVIIAILALKAAAWFVGLAGAVFEATVALRAASAAAVTFKTVSSNLALAGGLAAVGIALGIVVVAMDQYISRSRLAHETEMSRIARSQELTSYYNTLKANKEGLTEAEWGYAEQVKKTMEAERAALAVSLERTRAQLLASQTLNPFRYMREAGPGRNVLREQATEQARELQTIDNQLNILQSQWDRLDKLPTIKLPKIDPTDADKTGKKIADLLTTFQRAAEQAERIAAQSRISAAAGQNEIAVIERENAAYQALNSIEGLSAASKERLGAIIQGLVGRTQAATEATQQLTAARERDLQFSEAARQAEARLADALTGMTVNSRELTAQLEAEAIARSKNLDEMTNPEGYAREVQTQLQAIRVRQDYIAGIELEIDAIQKNQAHLVALRQAEAALADAKGEGGEATRRLTIQLAVEEEARKRGIQQGTAWYRLMEAIIALRQGEIDAINQQTVAQQQLNEVQTQQARTDAEFQDWRQQTAAVEEYGEEVAGILAQYGLLSRATRELFVLEESLARARAQEINLGSEEGQQRLAAIQAAVAAEVQYEEGLRRIQAEHELLAYTLEPMKEAWAAVDQQVTDALIDWATGSEVAWKDIAQSLLKTMLSAIVEMVKRWVLAHKAMQAEAAQTAAANAAAAAAGGGGGGGATGLTGSGALVQGVAGSMGGGGGAGGGAGGMGGWASLFANPAMMYLALALAVVVVTRIWTERKEGKEWRRFQYNDVEGQLPTQMPGYENRGGQQVPTQTSWARTSREIWTYITDSIQKLMDSIFATGIDLPRIDINVRKDSKRITAYVGGILVGAFKEVEDALNAAIIFAMQTADLSGVSSIVLNALRNSTAGTVEQLQQDLAMAQEIADLGLNQWQRRLREHQQRIAAMRREALRLRLDEQREGQGPGGGPAEGGNPLYPTPGSGISAFGKAGGRAPRTAADLITEEERRGFLALRDDVLAALGDTRVGIQRQARDIAEALDFLRDNMALLELSAEDLARVTREVGQRAFISLAEGLNEFVGDAGTARQLEALNGKLRLIQLRMEYEAIKLLHILTAEEMALLDELFRRAGDGSTRRRSGGGGGSGRAESREDAREQARRMGLDAVALAVDDARVRFQAYADSLKGLGFSAAENAALLAAADRQLVRELAAIKDEVLARDRSFIDAGTVQGGPLLAGLADLGKTERELIAANRQLHQGGLLTIREMRDLNIQIRASSRRQAEAAVAGAAGSLLMDLYQLLGDEKEAAQLRFDLTVAELQIRQQELQIAMQMLNYTEQQMQAVLGPIGTLVDRVIAAGPSLFLKLDDAPTELQQRVASWWASQHPEGGGAAPVDPKIEALRRLGEIEELRLSPLQREINAVNREFDGLRDVLGNTARVQTAYALAIQDVIQQHLDPVRGFLATLNTSQYSPLEQGQRLAAAQDAFLSTVAAIRGGNYEGIDNLATLAQDYLAQAMAALPTGSEAYRGIFASVNSLLNSILAQFGDLGADAGGQGTPPAAFDVAPVVSAVQQTGSETVIELRAIRNAGERANEKLGAIENRLERGLVIAGGIS